MRHLPHLIPILLLFLSPHSSASCLEEKPLKQLDTRYEQALRNGDTDFLAQLLKDEFIWVHTLASQTESKSDLLTRVGDKNYQQPVARTSKEVSVLNAGNTAVITGYTTVEQRNDDNSTRAARYHFMRTYILENGQCRLLASKTGKVWSSETGPL
ncbi:MULTISPECIES: nuclear transport factor 2 family protein [unclassified Microbulbifer]|uniref:nuclear transport factor 2 family protein n=1 Tax=unclassified Microbulbifer TaxID=2619833 RepID=UPI0027E3B483|nr:MULTISPECIES: nuclear transport factor 2 family protein [unclassified Microbulbifer]